MILDNERFTEEQKQIITNIGKKYKDNREKSIRKLNFFAFIVVLIYTSILIGIYFLDNGRIYTIGFLVLLGIVVGGLNYFKVRKNLKNILSKIDYEVGLYYADKDYEVIGNSYKRFKQDRIGIIIMAVLGFIIAIFMSLIAFKGSPVNYDNLTETSGILVEVHLDSDDAMQMKLEGDTTIYIIQSIYTRAIDINRIFDEVDLGDEVIFLVSEEKDVNSNTFRDVYYYEANSIEYMNHDLMIQGYDRNHNMGVGMVTISGLIGFGSFISYFICKFYYLSKKQQSEKYDLGIKTGTFKMIDNETVFTATKNPNIVTYAPKGLIILIFVLLAIFLTGFLLSLILISDSTTKSVMSIFSGVFTALMAVGGYDGLKNNEEIEGDFFISHRFTRVKRIPIREIKRVSMMGQFVLLLDSNNKTLVRMDRMTGNLDKILERLNEYGVVIEAT